MIKAISYWSMEAGLGPEPGIDSALTRAGETGFEGLELAVGTEGLLSVGTTHAECETIRGRIERSDVIVETTAAALSWGCNPVSDDPEIRRESLDLHAAALERTAWIGAKAMLMVPGIVGCPFAEGKVRYDLAMERCREAVGELLEVAEKVDVDLCLENVWNGMFYSPLEFVAFVDSFPGEKLGIYFDVGNVIGYHQWPPHWIELLGGRIKRVHVKDFKENFDWTGAYAFCDLGGGEVPWEDTMRALRGIGYGGTLVAEMLPYDPTILQRTSAAMDVLMDMGRGG